MEATKACRNCGKDFAIESDDSSFYEKINVPAPTLCPHCRMIRRLFFRNERAWYRRTCDATGKSILSMYSPDLPLTVYDDTYWKSDAWDALGFGRDYDFSRPFFEQFQELFTAVPHPNLIQRNNVNSTYTHYTSDDKNCYFCASAVHCEDSSYLFCMMVRTKNSVDGLMSSDCEYCYEFTDCVKCNRVAFAQNCEGCVESALLYDCRNCTNCFGCVGLRNAQYMIFNEQYTKEEYQKKMQEYRSGSYDVLQAALAAFNELKLRFPHKYAMIINAHNVLGDDISNARNCLQSFAVRANVENVKYSYRVWDNTKDGWDGFIIWDGSEMFYETVSATCQRVYFSAYIWGGNDIEYCYNCFDCSNCFGCVGLRSKSYCVFNKQYSKEEYGEVVAKIKEAMRASGEYGEFFPVSMSPFAYNETIAQDYFPLTKEQATDAGLPWRDPEAKHYSITVPTDGIPDSITDVPDTITKEVIACAHEGLCQEQCATAFRITPDELQFYRQMRLPLPRLCPNCRHFNRVKMKTPLALWHRDCMCEQDGHDHSGKCPNEFETAYAPERPEIIYCEGCYQKEVL